MKRSLKDFHNQRLRNKRVRIKEAGKRALCIVVLLGLIATCSSSRPEGNLLATYPTFKVFHDKEYDGVWEAVLKALKDYRLIRTDKENGYIKSALIDNRSDERFEFEVLVKKKTAGIVVTVNNYIQKHQERIGWKNITSNTVLEHSILTEIEKHLNKKRR